MAYQDFLTAFATAQGIRDADTLLRQHGEQYAFQIKSRERGKKMIDLLRRHLDFDFNNKRVLDIGCAYGSFLVEIAHCGAQAVGIDTSELWLKLAEANAKNEVNLELLQCDAASRKVVSELKEKGPFDLIVLNDVLEHVYDTAGLLSNVCSLLAEGGFVYYRVPNGLSTQHVLKEGHKKVFGLSLLAPDYWPLFVKTPFHIFYRRQEYFEALFRLYNLSVTKILNTNKDANIELTRRYISDDVNRIKRHLQMENFASPQQYTYIKQACQYYFEEVQADLQQLEWWDLYYKYRVTFWMGILSASKQRLER